MLLSPDIIWPISRSKWCFQNKTFLNVMWCSCTHLWYLHPQWYCCLWTPWCHHSSSRSGCDLHTRGDGEKNKARHTLQFTFSTINKTSQKITSLIPKPHSSPKQKEPHWTARPSKLILIWSTVGFLRNITLLDKFRQSWGWIFSEPDV